MLIRNAVMKDYESVIHIMNQVQQMHVNWRPDIYRPNPAMIPIAIKCMQTMVLP